MPTVGWISLLTLFCMIAGCAPPIPGVTRTVQINSDLTVGLAIPGQRWELARQIPEFLVEDQAEHLARELGGQGRNVSREELVALARKRLGTNELFLFNPATKAHLEVDFSPLFAQETAPSEEAVALSVRYAAESLSREEGVSDVRTRSKKVLVHGALAAYRLDAEFLMHGSRTRFVGVVGFYSPYWFYFYFTDPMKDPEDYEEMGNILKSLAITPPRGNKELFLPCISNTSMVLIICFCCSLARSELFAHFFYLKGVDSWPRKRHSTGFSD